MHKKTHTVFRYVYRIRFTFYVNVIFYVAIRTQYVFLKAPQTNWRGQLTFLKLYCRHEETRYSFAVMYDEGKKEN